MTFDRLPYAGHVEVSGEVTFRRLINPAEPLTYTVQVGRGGVMGGGPVLAAGTWTGLDHVVPIEASWNVIDNNTDFVFIQMTGNGADNATCGVDLAGVYTGLHNDL
jgi:hypothetical protein